MDEKSLIKGYTSWLKSFNLEMRKANENIQNNFNLKKLELVEYYNFDGDMAFPTPSENHMFLFAKCKGNGLIGLLNKKVLEAIDLETGTKLRVIDLPKFIDTNNKFYVFIAEYKI